MIIGEVRGHGGIVLGCEGAGGREVVVSTGEGWKGKRGKRGGGRREEGGE